MKTVEELEKEINNVEETLNNLKTKVEELKKSKNGFGPTPKDWKPKRGEKYWTAYYNLNPTFFICDEREISKNIIKYNRIFKTKEECQLYCDIQRAFRDASREFKYNSNNYYIWYDHVNKKIKHDCLFSVQHKDIYFDSEEAVQNLIDKFGEENIKRYYLGVY
ncbi:hypothetical protein [Faecalibacillus intestinalis]|jgi:ABC-type glycerol-3-phosphate transport system substrate-binding protein|uniref:hypothetical protein n=1 Tax=Faecalibacillus intestinalis TaxID=1982626 RepID=UPI0022E1710B|nr:hypothetical protein [Faecalibacillus intestinalis]